MAINKKLIHFNLYSNFITKKLSANVDNTQYTIGVDGTVYNVDNDNKPDILYHSIVFIKDVSKIWTHGQIYNCDGGITIVDSVDELDKDATQGSLAILNQSQKVVVSNTILKDAFAGNINSTPITKLEIHDPVYDLSLSEEISIFLVGPNVIEDTFLQLIAYNDGENNVLICVTLSPSFEVEGEITLWDSVSGVYQDDVDMLNAFISDSFGEVYVCKDGYYDDDENIVFIEPSEEDYSCINAFLFNVEEIPNSKLYIKSDKWRDANTYQIVHTPKGLNEYDQEGALGVCLNSLKLETVLCESLYQPIKGKEYYIDEDTGKIIKLTDKLNTIKGIVPINAKKSESFNTLYLKDFKSGLVMQIRDNNYAVACEIFDSENLNEPIISSHIISLDKFGNWNINELGINTINEFIAERNFEWLGDIEYQIDKGQNFNEIFHVLAEIPVKDVALYIKKESSWEKLKTGGSAETVDNLEDTSTDKALSANMGRVLNERISAVASGSVTSVAGTLNIKDLNAVKAAQELLSNNQQVTYIITDSDGNYPSPNNPTVYLDTEDHILDILYRGNGDALKWLLKNKQAYYNYSGSWYSQTISGDLVKLPSLHLRTAQVGDLITLIRQDIPAEEFYSKFVDYNNINLNLGTTEKLAFDTYLTFAGVKGALESISDGEAIRRLVEGGYIYSSEGDPNDGYTANKLVSDGGLVTLYTAQITPNTQHLYNGEFWTGNMTGAGMYSYINNPDPAIPDRELGEVYTGYVSPDGTQTLVSMKNPFKAYKKVNNAWEKLETDTNYKTRYGWGTSLDSMLKTGVCAYTPATVAGMDANWTIFVTCSSDGDPTYYHLMQTAICRNDNMLGRIFQRMGWYKGNGEDLHFTDWKEVGGGSSSGSSGDIYHCTIDLDSDTVLEVNSELRNASVTGVSALIKNVESEDEQIFGAVSLTNGSDHIFVTINDFVYYVYKEGEEWLIDKAPAYKADPIHCAIDIDSNTAELYGDPQLFSYIGYTVLAKSSEEGFEIVPSVFIGGTIFANSSDTNYTVSIIDEEGNTEVQAVPRYSNRFLTTESVEQGEAVTEYTLMTRDIAQELGNDETKVMSQKAVTDAINNAITNTLNTEV